MVWFFGGGLQGGANVQYPGHFLASKGAIVVVPNYRLNVIGKYVGPFQHAIIGYRFFLNCYNKIFVLLIKAIFVNVCENAIMIAVKKDRKNSFDLSSVVNL